MHVVFLTECSYEIGLGHLKRCLTLEEEFRIAGGVTTEFIILNDDEDARHIAQEKNILISSLEKSIERLLLSSRTTTIFIVDVKTNSYDNFIENLSNLKFFIFGIDDLSHRNKLYLANFSPPAAELISKTSQQSDLNYIGWEWVPIASKVKNEEVFYEYFDIKDIFLFFGGSDVDRLSIPSSKFFCSEFSGYRINLICGPLMESSLLLELQDLKSQFDNLVLHISPKEIRSCMDINAFYITAFGHTYYELVSLGISPTLIYRTSKEIAGIKATLSSLRIPHLSTENYLSYLEVDGSARSRIFWEKSFKNQILSREHIRHLSKSLMMGSHNIVNAVNTLAANSSQKVNLGSGNV